MTSPHDPAASPLCPAVRRSRGRTALVALAALALVVLTGCSNSGADEGEYPSKQIDFVIPYSAGGATDISARAVAKGLEEELGVPVVPINKDGAAGITGASEVAAARPDGHTLVYAPQGVYMQATMGQAPYEFDDFTPVRGVMTTPAIIVAPPESPADSLEELREMAPVKYGVPGFGNLDHLDLALIFDRMGVEATAIPFDGGGTTLQAVLGNQVDLHASVSVATVLKHIEAGRLKALGVITPTGERMAELPDVPTVEEQQVGVEHDDMFLAVWGVAAPKGVSEERLATLEAALAEAVQSEEFISFLAEHKYLAVDEETAGSWYESAESDADRAKEILESLGIR